MHKTSEVERQTGRIEELVRKLESAADPDLLATAQELVRSLMELYGAGLERMTEIVVSKGKTGREILDEFGRDELVGNLLAANGLHPLELEARVQRAVERLQTRIRSSGTVELLGIDDGVIRVRVQATGSGCGSSATSLRSTVEEAIYEAAPDVGRLVIEGLKENSTASGFVPLEKLVGQLNGAAI